MDLQQLEEELFNPYTQREIGKNGKRKKKISYRPLVRDLVKLLERQPNDFLRDKDGRLYGILRDSRNPVFIDYHDRGMVEKDLDLAGSQLMFVWIAQKYYGKFDLDNKRRKYEMIGALPEEVMEMPPPETSFLLYPYNDMNNNNPFATCTIVEYSENKNSKGTTALILCELFYMRPLEVF